MSKTRKRATIGIGTAGLILGTVAIWSSCAGTTPAPVAQTPIVSVEVAKAGRGVIANELTLIATLVPQKQAAIVPKVSAQISRMALLTNRMVRAGDVIAVLESRDLTAQRGEAAAALREAEYSLRTTVEGNVPLTAAQDARALIDARAAFENAQRTYERRSVLHEQGGISSRDLEASGLDLTRAQDDLRVAEANATLHRSITSPGDVATTAARTEQARYRLGNLDAQLGYTVIRAPFTGVVAQQFLYQGDFASPAATLVTLADASTLIAKVRIAEETAASVKIGDAARILPDDLPGQTTSGSVSLVGRGADPQSRTVEVWIVVPNADGRLRPNGVAKVVIDTQRSADAVIVPTDAVTLDSTSGSSGTVMVVDGSSIAREVRVTVGIRNGARVQITSGLHGGETVVTRGNYGLPDGSQVAIAKPQQVSP